MPRPAQFTGPWHELGLALNDGKELGLVQALCTAFDVDRLTVRRWANGERKPKGPAKILFHNLCEKFNIGE
jgi:hypothetical protein